MAVRLVDGRFDPWELMRAHQERHLPTGKFGATASFVGTMRDFNEGDRIDHLFLEHYPGMTERELERIVHEAQGRWSLFDVLVVHRVGAVSPGEPIVLVAVWAAHRRPAFEACRWVMEALKSRAPFWKKEKGPGIERWVGRNSPG